ncbi:hypothetical protein BaRGS_00028257 [Batillaria attramentaria]|uniref:Uncharacterized protein n=1 Tax=Batillaria attramentaria TaxID=370345 RepID=A0ABD0K112_9CAEN
MSSFASLALAVGARRLAQRFLFPLLRHVVQASARLAALDLTVARRARVALISPPLPAEFMSQQSGAFVSCVAPVL